MHQQKRGVFGEFIQQDSGDSHRLAPVDLMLNTYLLTSLLITGFLAR